MSETNGTYGLVVCGGKSSRMGVDKSMLIYQHRPQRYEVYEMLHPLCEQVYISCNAEQEDTIRYGYDLITDLQLYKDTGPMGALLSAFNSFPDKNILFIGCDYPFLSENDLDDLLIFCKGNDRATSFYNEEADRYEPLLAWYPHHCFSELKLMHAKGEYSLQHYLQNSKATKYYPSNKKAMQSVDDKKTFDEVLEYLNAEKIF